MKKIETETYIGSEKYATCISFLLLKSSQTGKNLLQITDQISLKAQDYNDTME